MNGLDHKYIGLISREAINLAVTSSGTNLQEAWFLWDIVTGGCPAEPDHFPEGTPTLANSPNAIAFDNKMFETVVTAEEWAIKIKTQPRTELGKRLLALREKIVTSGAPLLSWDALDKEIKERRGEKS